MWHMNGEYIDKHTHTHTHTHTQTRLSKTEGETNWGIKETKQQGTVVCALSELEVGVFVV